MQARAAHLKSCEFEFSSVLDPAAHLKLVKSTFSCAKDALAHLKSCEFEFSCVLDPAAHLKSW